MPTKKNDTKYRFDETNNFPEESCGTECPEVPLTTIPENFESRMKLKRKLTAKGQKQTKFSVTKQLQPIPNST